MKGGLAEDVRKSVCSPRCGDGPLDIWDVLAQSHDKFQGVVWRSGLCHCSVRLSPLFACPLPS